MLCSVFHLACRKLERTLNLLLKAKIMPDNLQVCISLRSQITNLKSKWRLALPMRQGRWALAYLCLTQAGISKRNSIKNGNILLKTEWKLVREIEADGRINKENLHLFTGSFLMYQNKCWHIRLTRFLRRPPLSCKTWKRETKAITG